MYLVTDRYCNSDSVLRSGLESVRVHHVHLHVCEVTVLESYKMCGGFAVLILIRFLKTAED